MLTVDFDRLGLQSGDRVIDMGCGAGRHAFEMYRRGADVIAFDQDGDELAGVLDLFGAMREAGELFPRPKMIVFAAFTFDPEAAKDIDAMRGIVALKHK